MRPRTASAATRRTRSPGWAKAPIASMGRPGDRRLTDAADHVADARRSGSLGDPLLEPRRTPRSIAGGERLQSFDPDVRRPPVDRRVHQPLGLEPGLVQDGPD